MWRVYVTAAVISCVVAAATSFTVLSLEPVPTPAARQPDSSNRGGGSAEVPAPREDRAPAIQTIVMEGEVEIRLATGGKPAEAEVFYKAAFGSPPHLTCVAFDEKRPLTDYGCNITDQKAAGFKLQRNESSGTPFVLVKWRAEGQLAK